MFLLSHLNKSGSYVDLWKLSQKYKQNIIKNKQHLEEIVENLNNQRRVIKSRDFVLINEDIVDRY